jgi:hypothetical protein
MQHSGAGSSDSNRPMSIRAFEALNIASIILAMVVTRSDGVFEELVTSSLWVALTLWITRGRSRTARVIYTLLLLFGAIALLFAYRLGYLPPDAVVPLALSFTVQLGLWLGLLWSPSSSVWIKASQPAAAAS